MYKSLTLPLIVTLFLHGIIIAVILIDAPSAEPLIKRAATKYIKAELVTIDKPKAKPKKSNTAKKKADDAAKRKRAEAKKKAERQRQLKAEQKRKLEKKRAEEKRISAEKKAAEQKALEQQRQQERQRQLKAQQEKELADAIAQENAQAQALTDTQLANSYVALITEVIEGNWNRPPSARNNMEVVLAIQLVPTGEVVSVRVSKSSGNAAFDRSAENAVLRAERFPELQQLPGRVFEKNFRRLSLRFKPEDLRL